MMTVLTSKDEKKPGLLHVVDKRGRTSLVSSAIELQPNLGTYPNTNDTWNLSKESLFPLALLTNDTQAERNTGRSLRERTSAPTE